MIPISWYQYLDVLKEQQYEVNFYKATAPEWMSCPRCGEPLTPAPQAAMDWRFCRYDGWRFPQDYIATMGGI